MFIGVVEAKTATFPEIGSACGDPQVKRFPNDVNACATDMSVLGNGWGYK